MVKMWWNDEGSKGRRWSGSGISSKGMVVIVMEGDGIVIDVVVLLLVTF